MSKATITAVAGGVVTDGNVLHGQGSGARNTSTEPARSAKRRATLERVAAIAGSVSSDHNIG
jgi:hypothetical protein